MNVSKAVSRAAPYQNADVYGCYVITRALGVDYRLEPEFTTVALQAGDVLLLCTDGLTNAVPMEQLEQLLRSGSFYDLPDALIRTANENGGPDNITALLVGIEPMEVRHG